MPRLKHDKSLLVASVLDDEANIMFLSKCKCFDDMLGRRYIDRILDIVPNDALIIDWGEWVAALVEEYRCHDGRWIFFAVTVSQTPFKMARNNGLTGMQVGAIGP